MGIFQSLSLIAVRQLAVGASRAAGIIGVEAVSRFLGDHFTDHSHRLGQALQTANGRAWNALEIALAGESLWNRLDDADDRAFRARLRAFLDATTIPEAESPREEFRNQCLGELRTARKAGLLLSGGLESGDLARQAAELAGLGDDVQLVEREWQALNQIADQIREAGHQSLARLVSLRPGDGKAPLIALAVRYYFRRAVETDAELHRGLSFAQWQSLAELQERGFEQLGEALDTQGQRLATLLDLMGEVRGAVLDLRREIAGQREQIQRLAHDVLGVLNQHQLAQRELRVGDSLSLRTDDERRLVRSLVSRYRELPPDQRRRMPALLNAVGKMEVVTGNFDAARRDFEELVQIIPDEKEKAEAFYNAYQAALESRQWDAALTSLKDAVALDAERFSPFPQSKYDPVRILGAGGFGVAFLCRDRHTSGRVVVKSLRVDGLDRAVTEVFTEARALEDLDHENIIRLRHCDYAGSTRARPYLVMDYFEGVSLAEHVAQHGPLSAAEVATLMSRVARALQKAHEKGICHRDVKPGNLLVRHNDDGWQIKLIDFGLALRQQTIQTTLGAASSYTQTIMGSSIAGTLDYAAPEQLGKRPGDKVGPHSDVYGLGKTACFALFGTTLPLARHWRSVSPELADLLGQCLAEDPRERPTSCKEVAERLLANNPAPTRLANPFPSVTEAVVTRAPEPTPESEEPHISEVWPFVFLAGLLGAVPGGVAGNQDRWHYTVPVHLILSLVTTAVVLLAATVGRRMGSGALIRPVPGMIRVAVLLSLVAMLIGNLLLSPYHLYDNPSWIFDALLMLVVCWALGLTWGRVFRETASSLVVGIIVLGGLVTHNGGFWLAGFLLGGGVFYVLAWFDPDRRIDRSVDEFLSNQLLSLARIFTGRKKSPTLDAATVLPDGAASIESISAPEAPPSPVALAIRLPLILIACALVAFAMGINAGATGFIVDQNVATMLMLILIAVGGILGGVVVCLIRADSFRKTAGWLVLGVAVSCGLTGLVGGIGWHVLGETPKSSPPSKFGPLALVAQDFESPTTGSPFISLSSTGVILGGLVLWGAALGLLVGIRRGYPWLGALAGTVLSGLIVLQGWLLGHPDPAGLFAIPFGLLGGFLLWSGLKRKQLWLARGLAAAGVLATFGIAFAQRDELGLSARSLGGNYESFRSYPSQQNPPLALSSRGQQLLLATQNEVRIVDLNSGSSQDAFRVGNEGKGTRALALAFSNDQPLCLLHQLSSQPNLSIFNVEMRKRLGPRTSTFTYSSDAAAASDDDYFMIPAAGSGPAQLHFYRHDGTGPEAYTLPVATKITASALRQDKVLLGFEDGYVRLVTKGPSNELRVVQEAMTHNTRVKRVGLSPDGRRAYILNDGKMHIWSVEVGKMSSGPLDRDLPTCAAFSQSGRLLLVGTARGTVHLWNVEHHRLMRTYKVGRSFLLDYTGGIEQVAFLPAADLHAEGMAYAPGRKRQWGDEAVAVINGNVVRWDLGLRRFGFPPEDGPSDGKDSGHSQDRFWERPPTKDSKPADKFK